MTEHEANYISAKQLHDDAKKQLAAAKKALLDAHGLEPCRVLTEDEVRCYEAGQIETDAVKISHFAKSGSGWDTKTLEELSEEFPKILKARTYSYRAETRIKVLP